jgi:glycosyltransferase involved in cell wall biosynthesis
LTPPKVIHLITLLEMGGAQGNTIYTVEHLPPSDFEVHLWSGAGAYWDASVRKSAVLGNRVRFFSCLVRPVNPIMDILAIFQLWRALRKERPSILHTHSSKAGIVGRIAARLAGVPVVIHTFHGFGFNDQQKPWTRAFFIWLERKMAPLANKLVFVSQSNQDEAQALGIGAPTQYSLIRSGVPLRRIAEIAAQTDRNDVRGALNIAAEAVLITTIGAFKPQKNLTDFIRMAAHVSQDVTNAHFLIIGDGAQRPLLQSLAEKLGIASRITMPGWREDVVALLSASNAFVLTSLWEGLPRAMLEALHVGVPALCYQTDGVKDLFGPQDPNVVPRKNWTLLAERLVHVLENPDQARAWINAGKAKITSNFDIDVMVAQQRQLYLELLKPDK